MRVFGLALVALLAAVNASYKPVYNHTDSLPRGWYVHTAEPLAVGSLVTLRAPALAVARGYVYAGELLLKPVAAMAGDWVRVTGEGVWVNGALVAVPLAADLAGRPLAVAALDRRLEAGELFLLSTYSARSYDGRYFGVVRVVQVMDALEPL